MTASDILRYRLINQQIAGTKFKKPREMVSWLCAIQAQEYAMSKWAIGLRLPGSVDAEVERAINKGEILRTHLLRPTWHFVTPADIRWMLELTAPRVNAVNAFMCRKYELDTKIFKRSNDILAKTLEGGNQFTRATLKTVLDRAKITAEGTRLSYIMMRAELDGIICSGAREGKQFTYALLDERAPKAKTLPHDLALAELTTRYFKSRGPATLADFVWWSGLTIKEAKEGIAMLKPQFIREVVDGREYLFAPIAFKNSDKLQTSFLMPDYDEYGISYKDRSLIFNPKNLKQAIKGNNPVYNRMIIIDGIIEGTWKRTVKNNVMFIETVPFTTLSKTHNHELIKAVERFRSFFANDDSEI